MGRSAGAQILRLASWAFRSETSAFIAMAHRQESRLSKDCCQKTAAPGPVSSEAWIKCRLQLLLSIICVFMGCQSLQHQESRLARGFRLGIQTEFRTQEFLPSIPMLHLLPCKTWK